MKITENANISDRYYIEAPEDTEDVGKFDEAVTEMSLVTPESNWYDFDNTYVATVEQIRALVEDYGVEPVVYESFDEQNGPHGRIYDVYSLVFDANPLDECVCAGQACGSGTISDFTPENVLGVKDIMEKDEKIKESKTLDFNKIYEASKEVKPENPDNYYYGQAEKNIEYSQKNPNNLKVNKKLSEAEVKPENPANFRYPNEEDNVEFAKRNPNNMKVNKKLPESIEDIDFGDEGLCCDDDLCYDDYFYGDDDLDYEGFEDFYDENDDFEFEESQAMPRAIRESRALPGGMINSEEKTAYEDWLRERHLKQDKVKAKEFGKNKLGLYDDECGENGWHNWDGTKIERKLNGKTIKK